jgi:hypothetical protein
MHPLGRWRVGSGRTATPASEGRTTARFAGRAAPTARARLPAPALPQRSLGRRCTRAPGPAGCRAHPPAAPCPTSPRRWRRRSGDGAAVRAHRLPGAARSTAGHHARASCSTSPGPGRCGAGRASPALARIWPSPSAHMTRTAWVATSMPTTMADATSGSRWGREDGGQLQQEADRIACHGCEDCDATTTFSCSASLRTTPSSTAPAPRWWPATCG